VWRFADVHTEAEKDIRLDYVDAVRARTFPDLETGGYKIEPDEWLRVDSKDRV
jgi:hypothetical protein